MAESACVLAHDPKTGGEDRHLIVPHAAIKAATVQENDDRPSADGFVIKLTAGTVT